MPSSNIAFPVSSETITATLYRPDAANGALPCVVMGHGFTLTRQDGIPDYAQRFAASGFAALAFDYRHWGGSTGEPRNWVSLHEQLADWRAAVEHARSLDNIDPERIAVWGMSMGGGHALLTAARDNRIAAAIALAPNADPLAAQPPPKIAARLMGRALRETLTRRPVTMPVAAAPGTLAFLIAPEALPGFERLTAGRDWHNYANTGWLLSARRWRAVEEAANIQAPVLLQLGERDRCVPLSAIEQTAARALHAELKRYDLDHFAYFWPENVNQVASDQIEFLTRHLQGEADRAFE
ncbi:MAG: alpha/beta hydrolase [Trebonia sp.]